MIAFWFLLQFLVITHRSGRDPSLRSGWHKPALSSWAQRRICGTHSSDRPNSRSLADLREITSPVQLAHFNTHVLQYKTTARKRKLEEKIDTVLVWLIRLL